MDRQQWRKKLGVYDTRRAYTTSLRLTYVEQRGKGMESRRTFTGDGKAHGSVLPWAQTKQAQSCFFFKVPKIVLSFTHENPHIPVESCNLAGDIVRIQTAKAASRHVRRLDPVGILRTVGSCHRS